MRIILFIPAIIAFLGVTFFIYFVSIIFFPVLGAMFLECPHAPFIFGYRAYKEILNGNFNEAFK